MRKKLFLLLTICILSTATVVPAFAMENETLTEASSTSGIQPRKDAIGWVYKNINGKLYKRQYNYSKDEWVGNWILCP